MDPQFLLTRFQQSLGIFGSALSWFRSYVSNITQACNHCKPSAFSANHCPCWCSSVFCLRSVAFHSLRSVAIWHGKETHSQSPRLRRWQSTLQGQYTRWNSPVDRNSSKLHYRCQVLDDHKQTSIKRHKNRSHDRTFKKNVYNTSLPSVIHIGDTDVPFVSSLKNLGVTLDSNPSMSQHLNNTCKTAYIQIRHISSIRHLLTTQATQILVGSLVLSELD